MPHDHVPECSKHKGHVACAPLSCLLGAGEHASGAGDFAAITSNVTKEECAMKEDLVDPTINIYTEVSRSVS